MAKLLKLRRGTTTQHASFTGAEGEVTVDITKDTAVVHDGAQAGGRPLAREDMSNVSSANIAGQLGTDSIATTKIAAGALPTDVTVADANISGNLTIANADVNSDAAIAGTKISPNFGSQLVETNGNLDVAGTAATGALTVSGNIGVSGTVDGVDIAALNTTAASLSSVNGSLANGVTATTQSQSDNTTKVATTAYVKTAVANVVDSAPAALDTLNELAASLGDDANFAATTATAIGSRLPLGGGQMTGNITMAGSQTVDGRDLSADGSKLDGIESGATADQTASEINNLLNSENITCAGLDAGSGIIRTNGWFYNDDSGDGLYNATTGQHWYSDSSNYWNMGGASAGSGIRFRDTHDGTVRGYVYYNTSNDVGFLNSSGSWSLKCDNSGNVTATGNVTAYSDARLKTDIHTINDALSICGKLRGVSYKWIKDGKASIGVIAQEVEEVIPEVVMTQQVLDHTGEREVKSVDYGKIVGVLINAINELKAEVDELKGGK